MNYIIEAFKALEDIDDDAVKITPKARKVVKESKDDNSKRIYNSKTDGDKVNKESLLKEEPVYALKPQYDSRQSFYGKANVEVSPDGKIQTLWSYNTPVCRIETLDNGEKKATLLRRGYLGWASSQTTLRHVKEFLKQNGLPAGSVDDLRKNYEVQNASYKQERGSESLTESEVLPINTKEEAEEAKEVNDELKDKQPVEKIVDAEAESIEDVKDSYLGNYVLICPTCLKYFFKKPDAVHKDEATGRFNIDEQCPHCGANDGFEIKYQIAKADLDTSESDEDKETTGKEEVDDKVETEVEDQVEVKDNNEEEVETEKKAKKTTVISRENESFENIDEKNFDSLINKYLKEVFSNVESYTTTAGKQLDEGIELEGTIKYTSGKEKQVKFIFENSKVYKDSRIKLVGTNETFTESKDAFALFGKVKNNCLFCESLSYNYLSKGKDGEILLRGRKRV